MIKIKETIIVEGRYDKAKLEVYLDAVIFPTNGFALFKDKNRMNLIKQLAEKNGIVILTDSDRAGFMIRNHIKSCISNQYIKNAYIPEIKGKEKRKAIAGKEGLMGVEGMTPDTIISALRMAGCVVEHDLQPGDEIISKLDFFRDGLSGRQDSHALRQALIQQLYLPTRISTNALLQIINSLYTYEEYKTLMDQLKESIKNAKV